MSLIKIMLRSLGSGETFKRWDYSVGEMPAPPGCRASARNVCESFRLNCPSGTPKYHRPRAPRPLLNTYEHRCETSAIARAVAAVYRTGDGPTSACWPTH